MAQKKKKVTKKKVTKKIVKKAKPIQKVTKKIVKKAKPIQKVTKKIVKKAKPIQKVIKKIVKKAKPIQKVTKKIVKKAKPIQKVIKKIVKKAKPIQKVIKKIVKKAKPAQKVIKVNQSAKVISKKAVKDTKALSKIKSNQDEKQPSYLKKSEREKLQLLKKELESIIEKETENKLVLKDMEGRHYCQIEDCDLPATVEHYCRLHYLAKWNYIIQRQKILETGVIDKTISQLIEEHSEGVLNYMIKDFSLDKHFTVAVKNMLDVEIDKQEEDIFLGD